MVVSKTRVLTLVVQADEDTAEARKLADKNQPVTPNLKTPNSKPQTLNPES